MEKRKKIYIRIIDKQKKKKKELLKKSLEGISSHTFNLSILENHSLTDPTHTLRTLQT